MTRKNKSSINALEPNVDFYRVILSWEEMTILHSSSDVDVRNDIASI